MDQRWRLGVGLAVQNGDCRWLCFSVLAQAPEDGQAVSLRLKTASLIGAAVLLLVAGLYAVLAKRNADESLALERSEVVRILKRATGTIEAEYQSLETLTLDWAVWDTAYDFVRYRDREFVKQNLTDSSLGLLGIDMIVIQDKKGKIIESRSRNQDGSFVPTAVDSKSLLDPTTWLRRRTEQYIVTSGLHREGARLYLVTQAPIIPSSYYRLPNGKVTFRRPLDAQAILRMSNITQANLTIEPVVDPSKVVGARTALNLPMVGPYMIEVLSERLIQGAQPIGRSTDPVQVMLKATVNREIYAQGQDSNARLLLSLVLFGIGLFALVMLLLERGLLVRLAGLASDLRRLAQGETGRVRPQGRDELGLVALQINAGLDTIQRTRIQTAQLELESERLNGEVQRLRSEELEQLVLKRTRELEASQLEMLERLAIVAEFRDDDTGQHTSRVGEMAAQIASRLGWSAVMVDQLRLAARLHDIGKIAISDQILHKPGKLSEAEWALMREHPQTGAQMLEGSEAELMRLAREVCLSHHERWNGRGYPFGLVGDAIPMSGRIVAIADAFDALTSPRPYKEAWSRERAIQEIRAHAGEQFDPQVVEVFLEIVGYSLSQGSTK
jgi:HD-GYP domain-containing protein (c-di-GMP phosphodiesterase class II)/sensor domain CHASE-containing protein